MKIARADEKDIEAGLALLGLLDTVSGGYYPSANDDEDDGPTFFDADDKDHLEQLWKRLDSIFDSAPGFQGRVIFGGVTLMDPRNEVIDPDDDCIALHPRLTKALEDAEKFRGLLLWTLYHHQGGSSDIGQPIRRALGIGQHDHMTPEQIEAGRAAADMPANAELCGGPSGPSERAPGYASAPKTEE